MAGSDTAFPQLTRRDFFRIGGASVSFFYLLPLRKSLNVHASQKLRLRGTAEYCIFLFLNGGPSQIDTFDFKEGRWTPEDFDLRTMNGGLLQLPYGLFPRLAGKLDDLAIVRSVEAWEVEHSRAAYYLQVAHSISPARRSEMPSVGAIIAHEMTSRRKEDDFLPPFVSINFSDGRRAGVVGAGCLDAKYNPLTLDTNAGFPFAVPDAERQRFNERWNLLRDLEHARGTFSQYQTVDQYRAHLEGAHSMMVAPEMAQILQLEEEERQTYGGSAFGDACILARNLIAAEAGTRYIFVSHPGWDSHKSIYDKSSPSNHYAVCRELDNAFDSLLMDLKSLRTKDGARLLDRTLIVCMGEFGRTVGEVTVNKGRDHHRFASTSLFAGGGVKGHRVIGATDETGGKVVDPGWGKKRSIYTEDVVATIYSSLGIDWSKKITNTPSGRVFEYLEQFSGTTFLGVSEIEALFG